jgi:hypothetical protein
MRRLMPLLLLFASPLAGAGQVQLQVSATILSRCQFSTVSAEARAGAVTTSVARCSGPGSDIPYRVSGAGVTSVGALPHNQPAAIRTTRNGEVLTIEF